jgi:excisionase family DNA binding protein
VATQPHLESTVDQQSDLVDTYARIRAAEAKLLGPNGSPENLPNNLYSFLLRLLAELKDGNAITILQNRHEFTTIEASKVLGMSRQYLVQLLEKNEIPFHMVGTHRRLYARDVFAYRAKRDTAQRQAIDDLAHREFLNGHYDDAPNDFHAGE